MPVTGDLTKNKSFKTQASAIPFTTVAEADLADAGSELNQAYLSGKQAGAGFIGDDGAGGYALYVAAGSEATDDWVLVGGDGTADITPA